MVWEWYGGGVPLVASCHMLAHPYCSSSRFHSHSCNICSKPGHLVWVGSYSLWESMRSARPLEHRAALSQNTMLLICQPSPECWDRQQAASPLLLSVQAGSGVLPRSLLCAMPLTLRTVAVAWRMAQWRGEAWCGAAKRRASDPSSIPTSL